MSIDIEEVKLNAARQFQHNDNRGFVKGYDIGIINEALEQQQAEIEKLKKAQEWISVKDELPDDDGGFLTMVKDDDDLYIHYFICEEEIKYWTTSQDVTHWQPLPEPPKEVKDE